MDYRDVLKQLDNIQVAGELTKSDIADLRGRFGRRFPQAWKILRRKGVKKYFFKPSGKVRWIVVGGERDYLIYEKVGYCSCDDFFYAVMDGKALVCQHLIAQKLAEALNMHDTIGE